MPRWTFVRHAESVANAEGWLAGHQDVALTPRGFVQAEALRAALAPKHYARLYSSDLLRARQTAALALGDDPRTPTLSAALRERSLGVWEGRSRAELEASGDLERLMSWLHGPPGGESLRDVALRIVGWCAANDTGEDTLVFAHATAIRATLGALDGATEEAIAFWRVGNTEVLHRDVPRGGWAAALDRLLAS